jgi:multiple sugar transport system permease protein
VKPAHIDPMAAPEAAALTEVIRPAVPGRTRRLIAKRLTPYGYLSPTAVLIVGLMVIPIVMVVSYSFKDNVIVQQNPVFAGLANYTKVLTDPHFAVALKNTFIFIALSMVAHLALGLTFDPSGVVNYILTTVGGLRQVNWLADPNSALWALTFINIWAGYPFFMISLLAGLQGISHDLYEAAAVDGANAYQKFRNVTIPQLRPVLISMAVLDLIWTSQQFALIWMTTGGGPLNVTEMLSTYTYKQAFSEYEFATASASAVIVLLLTMVLAFFYVRQQRER